MDTDTQSIESIGHALAFPVEPGGLNLEDLLPEDGALRIRTTARALAGMQKEAVIQHGPTGAVWRVVCDEGPWLNGTDLAPFPLAFFAAGLADLAFPAGLFDQIRPASTGGAAIIRKTAGDANANAPAVGLKTEQKRIVHVHTEGMIRDDGMKSIKVQCIQPQGSCFQMLSDDSRASGGQDRAPDGLVYLAAGVAFCFMTQIGRYAQITRQKLNGYRIIQDTAHRLLRNDHPVPLAVETLLCVDTDEATEKSIKLVQMAQQTCYVHAAFRSAVATEVSFQRERK